VTVLDKKSNGTIRLLQKYNNVTLLQLETISILSIAAVCIIAHSSGSS